MEDDYSVDMYVAAFEQDFDDVGWEPEIIDDSDDEAAKIFGY